MPSWGRRAKPAPEPGPLVWEAVARLGTGPDPWSERSGCGVVTWAQGPVLQPTGLRATETCIQYLDFYDEQIPEFISLASDGLIRATRAPTPSSGLLPRHGSSWSSLNPHAYAPHWFCNGRLYGARIECEPGSAAEEAVESAIREQAASRAGVEIVALDLDALGNSSRWIQRQGFERRLAHQRRVQGGRAAKEQLEADRAAGLVRRPIPKSVKLAVWTRDGGRCVECGSDRQLEFDHVIPWADGGSDTERNLQLLCLSCNRRKGRSL